MVPERPDRQGEKDAMELQGSRQIAADRATVWAALNDPEVLKVAIPGCQEMTGSAAEGFEATVKQKVGPVSATFHGKVELSNVVEGESYTISGEGKGGAAGFAKGGADVRLEDAEGGTLLIYDVKASVGGKIAQLGSRLIDGFAKKMADQFFENFQKAVEGPAAAETVSAAPPEPAVETAPEPAPAPAAPAPAPRPEPRPEPRPQPAAPAAEPAPGKKPGFFARLFGRKH
jgi:carbon monoxide dehydrogenase subunit G